MLIVNYTPPRWRKNESLYLPLPAPSAGPVLVAAAYDVEGRQLTLVFDRDVQLNGLEPSAITVADSEFTGLHLVVTGTPQREDNATVTFALFANNESFETGVILTAEATNGIAAVDGGETWEGVSGLSLPFGHSMTATAVATRKKSTTTAKTAAKKTAVATGESANKTTRRAKRTA